MKQGLLTFLGCITVILLTITISIAIPIYFRPFYYMQIDSLHLTEETGHTKEEIRMAYDQVLDYLTLPGKEFGTGVFPHSAQGKAHFEDCKALFDLNSGVLLASALVSLVLYFLNRKRIFVPCRPLGKHFTFISGIGTLVLFGLIGAFASINAHKSYVIFHDLFFSGKAAWLLRVADDPIILALPETFFLRCGILILSSILFISFALILNAIFTTKTKRNPQSNQSANSNIKS